MSAGLALFGLIAVALVSGCGDGGSEAGGDNILTPMKETPPGAQAAPRGGPSVAWSPTSLNVSLAPWEERKIEVEFTSRVNATGVTTFVVPELADYVTLFPASFASLQAGETYEIKVTLTSPLDMEVGEKDGTIMLREGRRALARPLPVNLSFAPKTYTVTATATPGGDISPASQVVAAGDVAEFTLHRDPDFGIASVTGCDGARVGDIYTTAPVVESCLVEAVFGELVFFGTDPINDTGIDWCSDAANNYNVGDAAFKATQCEVVADTGFPGQDGHSGRDALARAGELPKIGDGAAGFDYTKISNSGEELPATAMLGSGPDDWACTRDNLTWLMWEVKVDDPSHLRHQGHTYTWYDPNSPDGNPGTQNGGSCVDSACDTTGFAQAVNAQGLCGSSDWRMPTRLELQGIVDYGRHNPTIETGYFPNSTVAWFWWSASPAANDSDLAWWALFSVGNFGPGNRGDGYHVRLVHDRR